MQLFSKTQNKKVVVKKHKRFNPHRFWIWLLCSGVVLLTAELIFFSWFFLRVTKALDEPVLPSIETNAGKINRMKTRLDKVEKAIQDRTGIDIVTLESGR